MRLTDSHLVVLSKAYEFDGELPPEEEAKRPEAVQQLLAEKYLAKGGPPHKPIKVITKKGLRAINAA